MIYIGIPSSLLNVKHPKRLLRIKKHDGEFLGVFDLFDTTAKNWEKN